MEERQLINFCHITSAFSDEVEKEKQCTIACKLHDFDLLHVVVNDQQNCSHAYNEVIFCQVFVMKLSSIINSVTLMSLKELHDRLGTKTMV